MSEAHIWRLQQLSTKKRSQRGTRFTADQARIHPNARARVTKDQWGSGKLTVKLSWVQRPRSLSPWWSNGLELHVDGAHAIISCGFAHQLLGAWSYHLATRRLQKNPCDDHGRSCGYSLVHLDPPNASYRHGRINTTSRFHWDDATILDLIADWSHAVE